MREETVYRIRCDVCGASVDDDRYVIGRRHGDEIFDLCDRCAQVTVLLIDGYKKERGELTSGDSLAEVFMEELNRKPCDRDCRMESGMGGEVYRVCNKDGSYCHIESDVLNRWEP